MSFPIARCLQLIPALVVGAATLPATGRANGVLGDHVFANTMIGEDPFVDDEATLPGFSWLPQPSQGQTTSALSTLGFEFDKRITGNFGFAIDGGYQWLTTPGMKTVNGWQNLAVTLKFTPYSSDAHEFLVSIGLTRTFPGTGASGTNGAALDNPVTGQTTPRLYWGKGFGDLPFDWARPFAVTGSIGYQIADTKLKTRSGFDLADGLSTAAFNTGTANQWVGGLAVQYSLVYLQTHVKDFGLPAFVNRLTPMAEVVWSSPASKPNQDATQYLFGLGIVYSAEKYAVGVEALIPGNRQTGSHAGVVAQVHLFFEDLFPATLGKPISDW